jgi:hypothetical protein
MQLAQYLICIATRHEQAKEIHEQELRELRISQKKKKNGKSGITMTYANENTLLKEVVDSVGSRPACLKKVSLPAIGSLAYLFHLKMANDPCTEGHEIVNKLVCDPEQTINYLQSFTELKELGWIRLLDTHLLLLVPKYK